MQGTCALQYVHPLHAWGGGQRTASLIILGTNYESCVHHLQFHAVTVMMGTGRFERERHLHGCIEVIVDSVSVGTSRLQSGHNMNTLTSLPPSKPFPIPIFILFASAVLA